MSNISMPKNLSTTQQIDAVLGSIISGSQTLLSIDIKHYADLRASFLKFYSHPTFQLLLRLPPQSTPTIPPSDHQLSIELNDLKRTIAALSVTVASLKPKAKETKASPPSKPTTQLGTASAQGKGPTQSKPPMYTSKATSAARPSLMLKLGVTLSNRSSMQSLLWILQMSCLT